MSVAARADLREEVHYGRRMRCYWPRAAGLYALLEDAVARRPLGEALVAPSGRQTWRALAAAAAQLAAGLARRGVGRGDRVAVLLGNDVAFVWSMWAVAQLGAVLVPINLRHRTPEIAHALNDSGARLLIFDAAVADVLPEPDAVPGLERRVVVAGAGTAGEAEPFADLFRLADPPPPPAPVGEEDPVAILYTSGTTGRPKGAILTGLGMVHSTRHYAEVFALEEGERALLAVPASHVTGLVALIATSALLAGTVVAMDAFRAGPFLRLAARERITWTLVVPAMLNLCLRDPAMDQVDLGAWRFCGYGGAPMPEATIAGLASRLPALRLGNAYGATETTSPTTLMPPALTLSHPDSVGRVVPCGAVRVVDADGRAVAPGTVGELQIAGPMVVPGYWGDARATRESFVDGHWRSGDLGTIDADGFVRVLDRLKDMINRAGYKVYSVEVENVLAHHPDVAEAAVVGRPCPVLGERVHAFVRRVADMADGPALGAFCAARLADYKVPEAFTFVSDPLPRNANGKVVKTALRRQLAEG